MVLQRHQDKCMRSGPGHERKRMPHCVDNALPRAVKPSLWTHVEFYGKFYRRDSMLLTSLESWGFVKCKCPKKGLRVYDFKSNFFGCWTLQILSFPKILIFLLKILKNTIHFKLLLLYILKLFWTIWFPSLLSFQKSQCFCQKYNLVFNLHNYCH